MNARLLLAGAALALLGAAPGVAADPRSTTVGGDGTVYVIRGGAYGELFSGIPAAKTTLPVLALDVTPAGGTTQRLLVPGTDDPQIDESPVLLLQEPTGDLFLLWSSRSADGVSLLLRSFAHGKFSGSVALDDNPRALKSAPQVTITRDAYTSTDPRGVTRAVQRTVLHLLWWEADPAGDSIMYRSVLFVNGELVGADDLVDLGDLDLAAPEANVASLAHGLVRAPMLAPGRNERASILGFVGPRTGRLFTIEVAVVPGELSSLADDLRDYLVAVGTRDGLGDLVRISEMARAHLIGGGRRFSDGVLLAFGEQVRAHLIGGGRFGGDAVGLAEDTRRYLLREGANLLENGLDAPDLPPTDAAILELPSDDAGATHQVQLRIMGKRPAPVTLESNHRLFTSPDGARVVVAWDAPGQLRYTEWRDGAWSPALGLNLSTLSLDAAESAIERRVREP